MEMTYVLRAAGMLPHMEIAGTDFTIDWRLRELRETAAPWNHLDIDRGDLSPDGEWYLLLYDTQTHEQVELLADATEVAESVVFIEIPNEIRLDPYAVAKQWGEDPAEFVAQHPFETDLKARIIPLSETRIPEIIAQNLRQQDNDQGQHRGR